MNTTRRQPHPRDAVIGLLAILCAVLIMLSGCAPHENPVQSIGVTGGGNSQTQDWNVGVTITFKTNPPAHVLEALTAAGASGGGLVWTLPPTKNLDSAQDWAVVNALTVPGTIVTRR